MELTDKQKKTLEIFSKYAKSYGKNIVTLSGEIRECSPTEFYNNNFSDKERGADLQSYPKIIETIIEIVEKLHNKIIELMEDCYNYGYVDVKIDCNKREIEIEVSESSMIGYDTGFTDEIPDTKGFNSLVEYMKEKGYSEAKFSFNGSGDSGYIENQIEFDEETSDKRLGDFDNIEDHLYDLLSNTQGGWEINEGSTGVIVLNLEENSISVDMTVYEQGYESRGIVLRSEF